MVMGFDEKRKRRAYDLERGNLSTRRYIDDGQWSMKMAHTWRMYVRNFGTRNSPFVQGEDQSQDKTYEGLSVPPLKICGKDR